MIFFPFVISVLFSCSDKLKAKTLLGSKEYVKDGESGHIGAKIFTFRELAVATRNFRGDCLLGEGGFGRVYKGQLDSNQVFFCHLFLFNNGMKFFFRSPSGYAPNPPDFG